MKRAVLLLAMLALAQLAVAQTWENATLIDAMCATKANIKADPGSHPRACALQCSKAGYGVITPDGKFLKFDDTGNAKAAELLKSTSKADHLKVRVSGTQAGDQIKVDSISLL
jgi:hypothetical protein